MFSNNQKKENHMKKIDQELFDELKKGFFSFCKRNSWCYSIPLIEHTRQRGYLIYLNNPYGTIVMFDTHQKKFILVA